MGSDPPLAWFFVQVVNKRGRWAERRGGEHKRSGALRGPGLSDGALIVLRTTAETHFRFRCFLYSAFYLVSTYVRVDRRAPFHTLTYYCDTPWAVAFPPPPFPPPAKHRFKFKKPDISSEVVRVSTAGQVKSEIYSRHVSEDRHGIGIHNLPRLNIDLEHF